MFCRGALLLLAVPLLGQVPFSQMVVFGDSLSDNGNLYIGTTRIGFPQPGPPLYTKGEYTDGPDSVPGTSKFVGLWEEQLAKLLNVPVPQPFLAGGTNFAVATALTGKDPSFSLLTPSIPYLTDQVNVFLGATPTPPVNALYAFWGGSNDILGGLDPLTAAANVQGNIDTLATAGAKYFLWANLPPLGEVPQTINTDNRAALNAATVAYNTASTAAISQLKAAHPGITIIAFDAYALFNAITQNPARFGFTDLVDPAQGLTTVDPNTYLFWDTLHPTTAAHAYLAQVAYSAILAGFGGPAYTCTNTIAPKITGVASAGAYGAYPYFASGSWIEIYGSNLADPVDPRMTAAVNPSQWNVNDFTGLNAPTLLDGISVSIDNKPAYVWYVSPTQLNVQAPEDATLGPVAITATNCKATSAPFQATRQALAPGFLTNGGFSAGAKQYMVATFTSDGAFVLDPKIGSGLGLSTRAAKPGDLIVAYGIGFGNVTPSILPGTIEQASNGLINPVQVSFGSSNATVVYQGLAGAFVGLYEFYITVPAGLADGDYQINVTQAGAKVPQTLYLTVKN
jgi:uncharacterized protein (TIGR03437 family)